MSLLFLSDGIAWHNNRNLLVHDISIDRYRGQQLRLFALGLRHAVQTVAFRNCRFTDSLGEKLAMSALPELDYLRTVRVVDTNATDVSAKFIALALRVVCSLTIDSTDISDKGLDEIAAAMSADCLLETLRVRNCVLPLSNLLDSTVLVPSLTTLNLSGSRLDSDATDSLCFALVQPDCNLRILNIGQCAMDANVQLSVLTTAFSINASLDHVVADGVASGTR